LLPFRHQEEYPGRVTADDDVTPFLDDENGIPMPQTEASLPTYSPEEEKRIIRNADGVPVGIRPDNRWTPVRISTWVAITALGVLGWWMLAVVRGEHVNTIWFVVTAVCTYAIGYRFYALYIQRRIMRPDDDILTKPGSGTFAFENRNIGYSMKRTVEYAGEDLPVVMYWDVEEYLSPGTYRVDIFADGHLIGRRSFTLQN